MTARIAVETNRSDPLLHAAKISGCNIRSRENPEWRQRSRGSRGKGSRPRNCFRFVWERAKVPTIAERSLVSMQNVTTVELTRDCEAVQIPVGTPITLPKGTTVDVTQTLGGT